MHIAEGRGVIGIRRAFVVARGGVGHACRGDVCRGNVVQHTRTGVCRQRVDIAIRCGVVCARFSGRYRFGRFRDRLIRSDTITEVHGGRLRVCGHAVAVFVVHSCDRRRNRLTRSRDRRDRRFRLESIERRLPRAIVFQVPAAFLRRCAHTHIVVATRRTRSRPIVMRRKHWIAEQVERAFVARRIAGCRALRLRSSRRHAARGRSRTLTRACRRTVGTGTRARRGNGFGHVCQVIVQEHPSKSNYSSTNQ
ncbi:hypothetical protein [Burkholderia multivorans]|uniref:hypothetical protein n=1 Tax=Burkholderia multivorans TaxID=87883 RepID=UPI001ED96ABE|nr:hypothetical protein [Burkholderia multivorans]